MRQKQDNPFPESFGHVFCGSNGQEIGAIDPASIVDRFRQKQVLLFRGFGTGIEEFSKFTEQLGKDFLGYGGGAYDRKQVGDSPTLLSVSGNVSRFVLTPMHGEMHYKRIKPDILWFYCDVPPRRRGWTTVCDGAAIFHSLRPATREMFSQRKIRYVRTYDTARWQKIFKTRDLDAVQRFCDENGLELERRADGTIVTSYRCSALVSDPLTGETRMVCNILPVALGPGHSQVLFDDGSRLPWHVLLELFWQTQRQAVQIRWQAGDVLMVDNQRMMHGRTTIWSQERNILIRMGKAGRA